VGASSGHARFSPSAAKRWLACPGSVAACDGIPSTENEWSIEGTNGHTVAALMLEGQQAAALETAAKLNVEHLLPAVHDYVEEVRSAVFLGSTPWLQIEKRVHVTAECYGTADALVVDVEARRIDVHDLKLGAGTLVYVDGNEQLLTYAVGAWRELPFAAQSLDWTFGLHIHQPRRPDADGRTSRSVDVSMAELRQHEARLTAGIAAANKPGAPLVPGDHCQYCPAAATCPALHQQAQAAAVEVFGKAGPVTPPNPASLTAERIAEVLTLADAVETWIEVVRKEAYSRASSGLTIPGRKLVERLGNRKWTDERRARDVLEQHGVDPMVHELVSPAEAERRLGKAQKALVAELTHRPVTGTQLVMDSDKRPALSAGGIPFTALPTSTDWSN
jgi:hypothetical protein